MTQQTRVRRVAALAAGALASTTLATVGLAVTTPAQAALATGSFKWEISQQFDDHLSTHELADGATEDADGVISFPATSTSVDPATGVGTVQYDGSVKGSFVNAGSPFYWVKLEDPAVSVAADGEGQITALVSAWNTGAMGSSEATTSPARVVVTTFDAAGKWSTGSVAATPDWAGILPEGAGSVELGIGAGKPVDGKSFAPTFLGQITSGVRAHFYASGATSDPKKAPSAFTASYVSVAHTVTATPSYANQSVSIKVDGAGFTGTDGNPGDDGVYVGLAPAGGLPSTATQADMDKFAAAQWIPAASVKDGAISTTLTATAAVLKQGTAYSVYTWRAHSHSTTTQDTETPVTIDWSKLTVTPATPTKAATKVTAKVTKKPTTAKGGTLSIGLKGTGGKPAGKVTVKLTSKGKKAVTKTAKAKNGKAVVKLPKLKAGSWKATVVYAGSGDFKAAKDVVTFKVKKSKKKR
jgi:hypothetical protein